jgi:hypothetical protein
MAGVGELGTKTGGGAGAADAGMMLCAGSGSTIVGRSLALADSTTTAWGRVGSALSRGTAAAAAAAAGMGRGVGTEGWSARDAPQNLQNCELTWFVPRQRAHVRVLDIGADGGAAPMSTTRTGAMGLSSSGESGGSGRGGGGGGSGTAGGGTAERAAAGIGGGATLGDTGLPHEMQKRSPRWLNWPQDAHRTRRSWGGSPAGGDSAGVRAANRKSGACGRTALAGAAGAPARGCGGGAGRGGGARAGGAGSMAPRGVAAAVMARGDGPVRPMGGVGGATRGRSRCPHS